MRGLLIRFVFFTLLLIPAWYGVRSAADYWLNQRKVNQKDAIFVWGDSQTLNGIDLKLMKSLTNRNVFSAAKRGAGVYDLAVFSEYVPPNSLVILGLSKNLQVRRPENDFNRSGLSFQALRLMHQHGFSFPYVFQILKNNLGTKGLFITSYKPYPVIDTVAAKTLPVNYLNVLDSTSAYIDKKQSILTHLVRELSKKQCTVFVVEFPLDPVLSNAFFESPVDDKIVKCKKTLSEIPETIIIDSLVFDADQKVMYDLTHLNDRGRRIATRQIFEKISAHLGKKRLTGRNFQNRY